MKHTVNGINQAIRVNLARRRMSQKDLANRSGMRLEYLNIRLNGHRSWSIDDLDAISKALEIGDALDLLKLADKEADNQQLVA